MMLMSYKAAVEAEGIILIKNFIEDLRKDLLLSRLTTTISI